jgi:hypothetical protein
MKSEPTLQRLAAIMAAASQRLPLELHCLAKNLLEHVNFWGAGDGTRTRDSLLGNQIVVVSSCATQYHFVRTYAGFPLGPTSLMTPRTALFAGVR